MKLPQCPDLETLVGETRIPVRLWSEVEVRGSELQERGQPCLGPLGLGRCEGRLFWNRVTSSQAGGQVRKKGTHDRVRVRIARTCGPGHGGWRERLRRLPGLRRCWGVAAEQGWLVFVVRRAREGNEAGGSGWSLRRFIACVGRRHTRAASSVGSLPHY